MKSARSIRLSSLSSIALLGATGGGINAWLCYVELPVSAGNHHFEWHIIPAGAAHGALLALVTVACASLLRGRGLLVRLLSTPFVVWLTAYLSFIPLNRSAFHESWSKILAWPFDTSSDPLGIRHVIMDEFSGILITFGLVALIYYLWLVLDGLSRRNLGIHLLVACAAGIFGSLWWWIEWKPWYLSLLHGTVWGLLVGYGTCRAVRAATPESSQLASHAAKSGQ